jgi:hypothetical protein
MSDAILPSLKPSTRSSAVSASLRSLGYRCTTRASPVQ